MAYAITDMDGTVLPVDATNPFGYIKDDPGGTRINHKGNGDVLVFFQQLMSYAGITPNGLNDDNINGFQLFPSLFATVGAIIDTHIFPFTNVPGGDFAAGFSSAGSPRYDVAYSYQGNICYLSGVIAATGVPGTATTLMVTLPAPARPAKPIAIDYYHSALGLVYLTINSAGLFQITTLSSGTGATTINLDGLSYRLS
jgi:hypothetical protein